MSNKKPDCNIGYRAVEEMDRIQAANDWSTPLILRRWGIPSDPRRRWADGGAPTAAMLQLLCMDGADVIYILTGKRGK